MCFKKMVFIISSVALLSACGGGSSGGSGSPDQPEPYTLTASVVDLDGVLEVTDRISGKDYVLTSTGDAPSFIYTFERSIDQGFSYDLSVQQQPTSQSCFIQNGSGTFTGSNIEITITCTDVNQSFTVSGSYTIEPYNELDSDTNDPNNPANEDNGVPATAQEVSNVATIQGFVTAVPTTDYDGPDRDAVALGDRFADSTDRFDAYRVNLQAGQIISLQIADYDQFDSNRVFSGDLDLYLYRSSDSSLIAQSASTSEFERIEVSSSGEYDIVVEAFSGTSRYSLVLSAASRSTGLAAVMDNAVDIIPGESIVKYKEGLGLQTADSSQDPLIATSTHRQTNRPALVSFDSSGVQVSLNSATIAYDSSPRYRTLQNIKRLSQRSDVEYAEPNFLVQATAVPNDRYYDRQWHYRQINLPEAWDVTTGENSARDIIVAVIDTGVFSSHQDLAGQLVPGYDFIRDPSRSLDGDGIDPDPDDPGDSSDDPTVPSSWHGTHVAGTVAADSDNSIGVAGVSWGAKVMPLRALGKGGGSSYAIQQSVLYAAGLPNDSGTVPSQRADIINLSLGGRVPIQSDQNIYSRVRDLGVIVIAAAGNDGDSVPIYPAAYDDVVSVSAVDQQSNLAWYSSFGNTVDVSAPGGDLSADTDQDGLIDGVLSLMVDVSSGSRRSTYGLQQGTSMAAPHMAGVVALMKSVYPDLMPSELDQLLMNGSITRDLGTAGRDDRFGYGLIDAFRAVEAARALASGGSTEQSSIVASDPHRIALGTADSAMLEIVLQNGPTVTVEGTTASETWLAVREDSVDPNGLGSYLVEVDRSGLAEALYSGNLTFSLDNGNTIVVPVTMQVGGIGTVGNVSTMYVQLRDADFELIDQTVPVANGNGVFSYEFVDVDPGSYIVLGGTDVDNDFFICQTSEACGSYPVSLSNGSFNVIDSDRTGLDFSAGIETSASTSQSQPGLNNGLPPGFRRTGPQTDDNPLPVKRTPEVLPQ